MAKKRIDDYPPLALLRSVSAAYPAAWADMAAFHAQNGTNGLPRWDARCYAPIGAALAVVEGEQPDDYDIRAASIASAQQIAALAPWRLSKEVYVIDPDMQELLFDQSDDMQLDPHILLDLPYPCFYIEFSAPLNVAGNDCHGVFVHLEHDTNSKIFELRLLYLCTDGCTMGVPINLDVDTIADSVRRTTRQALDNLPARMHREREMLENALQKPEQLAEAYAETLQIVLYICAQNAEITPSPEQASITRRSSAVKDRYAEIRKWDVGVRIGSAVRAYYACSSEPDVQTQGTQTHTSPRPHMRRGHWHHFWTGRKSLPTERKLVLKWVAPTFIAVPKVDYSPDLAPVVLHPVRRTTPDKADATEVPES